MRGVALPKTRMERLLRNEPILRITLWMGVPMLAALACLPVLNAGFQTEDFTWLAIARQLDTPSVLLRANVVFAYFYRPVGLLFWRLCAQLGGSDPWVHNLIDLLLHAFNAVLLALLAKTIARSRSTGILAGVLFACLPATSATALWMSDRFDPLSLCFGLLALLACERAWSDRRVALWASACLLLSLTAKEIGCAAAAAMLALLAAQSWQAREWRFWRLLIVLGPLTAAFGLHMWVVTSVDASLDAAHSALTMVQGVAYWWQRFPAALFGFRHQGVAVVLLLGAAGVLVAAGLLVAIRRRDQATLRLALVGSVLLVVPALVQWPVTQLVLGSDASLAFITNLRFYYVAMGGLALLWAAGHAGLHGHRWQWLLTIASFALAVQGFVMARDIARDWSRDTHAISARYVALGKALGARSFSPGCRIELHAPHFPLDFAHFADVLVKATAPVGASVLGCAVFAGAAPYMSLVSADRCNDSAWPSLTIRRVQGLKLLAPLGNLCMVSFDAPHFDANDASVQRFDVNAAGEPTPAHP